MAVRNTILTSSRKGKNLFFSTIETKSSSNTSCTRGYSFNVTDYSLHKLNFPNRINSVTSLLGVSFHRVQYHSCKMCTSVEQPIIPIAEAHRFISDCLEAVGAPKEHACAMGALLSVADYRGHFSHGMNRLEMYINDILAGTCDAKVKPTILKETVATAWVDGKNGLGAVVGNFCMELAIQKAKEVGIGWVVAKGSNHYGIAGMYTIQAINAGMLGMSFTNTSPFMVPTRAKEAALGTNPLSLGVPANNDSYVLDMATTAVAVGKIEIQKRKAAPIPEGWATDETGKVTTNATQAYDARRLMPLGGDEIHSGYKGYGLGVLVEIFCGMLSGSKWGPHVRKWGTSTVPADLGQCFVAINPEMFAPGFECRMSELINHLRSMESVEPGKEVLIAGDPETNHMKSVDAVGGVRYVPNQMQSCAKLAEKLKVKPLQGIKSNACK